MYRILFLVAASAAVSCVQIDGGAVEVSWVVVSVDGHAISPCACTDPQIDSVRLKLMKYAGPGQGTDVCAGRTSCQFSCDRNTGATPFNVDPGEYLMSLVAVDATGMDLTGDGAAPSRVVAPAPVLRDVIAGQPTQLDAFALVAGCAARCANKINVCNSQ